MREKVDIGDSKPCMLIGGVSSDNTIRPLLTDNDGHVFLADETIERIAQRVVTLLKESLNASSRR
jgi:hypothetical protein